MASLAELYGLMPDDLRQLHPLLQNAIKKYPFIARNNPSLSVNPAFGKGYAETYPADEEGTPDWPRPSALPQGTNGIEVYQPTKFGPDDIAGEFLHVDPHANATRAELSRMLTDRQKQYLKGVPDYTFGEGLSQDRRMGNAIDSLMRGYTVNQWPKQEVDSFLTMPQKMTLDKLLNYMRGSK